MAKNPSFKIKKLSPQLLVTDIDRSLEFYTNQLGFTIAFRYEDFYAGIIKDVFSIHLKAGKALTNERQDKKDDWHPHIVFSVEEIEHLYREIAAKPVEIIQALRQMPYGKEFYIADPDSNIMAFVEEI